MPEDKDKFERLINKLAGERKSDTLDMGTRPVTATMPVETIEQLNLIAEATGESRSATITRLVKERIEQLIDETE